MTVLEFEQAMLDGGAAYDLALRVPGLRLEAGELALVQADPDARGLPLADAASGLLAPAAGRVRFMGSEWAALSPDEQAARRARIGRVFFGTAWISNLDVDENITLRLRHHTRRAVEDIDAEALAMGREFGFEALPVKRPAWLGRDELMRAQWVRALIGQPPLVLLEFPETGVPRERLSALAGVLGRLRAAGGAVLWITADAQTWTDDRLKPSAKYRILAGTLEPVMEHA